MKDPRITTACVGPASNSWFTCCTRAEPSMPPMNGCTLHDAHLQWCSTECALTPLSQSHTDLPRMLTRTCVMCMCNSSVFQTYSERVVLCVCVCALTFDEGLNNMIETGLSPG